MLIRLWMILLFGFVLSGQAAPSYPFLITDVTADGDLKFEDGRVVKLADIQMPLLRPDGGRERSWPLAKEAREELRKVAAGKRVGLFPAGERQQDRHGRLLAHLMTEQGLWLQEALLRAGYARFQPTGGNAALQDQLMAAEQTARNEKRGLWRSPYYRVKNLTTLNDSRGRYEIIQARIWKAAEAGSVLYLNFGEDWRQDFTIRIDKRNREAFQSVVMNMDALAGRLVEIRGWVRYYNGLMIDMYHPGQIRYIEENDAEAIRRETDGNKD